MKISQIRALLSIVLMIWLAGMAGNIRQSNNITFCIMFNRILVSFKISIFFIFLNFNSKDSCCCPAHFLENTCGCNFFNCNCDTSPDGYCIYSDLGGKCIADNCEKACESTFLDERFCKNKTKVISSKIYFISYEIKNSLIKHCLFFLLAQNNHGGKE